MTNKEIKSCVGTIEMLRRLAYNIHGVMDVIDADNCEKIIKALEQEQDKPMVEIDLYSVIKQKYIEREVLDKISAEIEEAQTYDGIYIDRAYVLGIIDKRRSREGVQAV